jgi:ABC-type antimicrobial peptide transport system permease subunit
MFASPTPVAIVPLGAEPPAELVIALRGTVSEERLRRTLRATLQTVMPAPAPVEMTSLKQELLGDTYSLYFSFAAMCCLGLFGGSIALLGVYSMTSYRITSRVREFGIRAALGATRAQIYALVFGESRSVLTAGIISGMLAAAPMAFMLRSVVPRLRIVDPLTFVAVPLVFMSAGFLATALPLRRILNRDLSLALREL